jgi:hypothetical protein
MIEYRDLVALAAWCRARGLCWLPGRAHEGSEALLLERSRGLRASQSMLLVHDRHGFCLIDSLGDLLASASALPSLLDALDGGIAEASHRRADPLAPIQAAAGRPAGLSVAA